MTPRYRPLVVGPLAGIVLALISGCSTDLDDPDGSFAVDPLGSAEGLCTADDTCPTDYCQAGRCATPTPDVRRDGRRNAGESGVDCGGSIAQTSPCSAGQACTADGDCASRCTAGRCEAPNPSDGKRNVDETDVDCGGTTAPKCDIGKTCASASDCGLAFCSNTKCAAPTATDKVRNGTESDIDCGGAALDFKGTKVAAAPRCELQKSCGDDADCESGVCTSNKICIEAPSCRKIPGGQTCGKGETARGDAMHESCCKTLPLGISVTVAGAQKQAYLDKYEITAGRVREWLSSLRAQNGGVANIREWVNTRVATDPVLAGQIPVAHRAYLPTKEINEIAFVRTGNADISVLAQVGPTSYYRGVDPAVASATSGCAMGTAFYGHRTLHFSAAEAQQFNELARPASQRDGLDEKSMNCMTPVMFAAFCAWDGGYLPTPTTFYRAWGEAAWPWGATPSVTDETAKIGNFNQNTVFGARAPRYLFPTVGYETFGTDFSPIIAAPGRFVNDVAAFKPLAGSTESFMDLGANMIELINNDGAYTIQGGSFEGHAYARTGTPPPIVPVDKYGKIGARCMRLR